MLQCSVILNFQFLIWKLWLPLNNKFGRWSNVREQEPQRGRFYTLGPNVSNDFVFFRKKKL